MNDKKIEVVEEIEEYEILKESEEPKFNVETFDELTNGRGDE